MKMRMFSMLLALCLLLSTGVLAASPEAVTGSAQALETGMELTHHQRQNCGVLSGGAGASGDPNRLRR